MLTINKSSSCDGMQQTTTAFTTIITTTPQLIHVTSGCLCFRLSTRTAWPVSIFFMAAAVLSLFSLHGCLLFTFALFHCRFSLSYQRPPPRSILSLFHSTTSHDISPQQVHVSLVGQKSMRISWVSQQKTNTMVRYTETENESEELTAFGNYTSYKYLFYESGYIHDAVVGPLRPNTNYNFHCDSTSTAKFSFKTPPAQFPIKFAIVGDLGQTGWTQSTLEHIESADYDVLLLAGDLSYADMYQPLWDSFGRLVQPLASKRPWMVTQGNHEVEKIPFLHEHAFTSFNARWRMPYEDSGSDSNLYYSFDVAGVHVLMLASYADLGHDSPQMQWLRHDLSKFDRGKTPWLIAVFHAPWYNSNSAHQGEPESIDMKASMEELLYTSHVDVVFSGHVHAYERFDRVYDGKADECGPVYIVVGDGGNREGLARRYLNPVPRISMFREASFGHGRFEVVNSSHAVWTWHRNDNDNSVAADSVWLKSLAFLPKCKA